jgi:hypothetical protein
MVLRGPDINLSRNPNDVTGTNGLPIGKVNGKPIKCYIKRNSP